MDHEAREEHEGAKREILVWPFSSRRARIKQMFAQYVGEEGLDALMRGELGPVTQPAVIDYILVLVDDRDAERVSALAGRVGEIAHQQGAMLLGMEASFIYLIYGGFPVRAVLPQADGRRRVVRALRNELGAQIAVVHGTATGRVGTIGSTARMTWTAVIPGFKQLLRQLSALEYGEEHEVMEAAQS